MNGGVFDALRADALKWREIAAQDGGGTDRKAEEMLALLAELDRLRLVEAEYEAVIQQQQAEVRGGQTMAQRQPSSGAETRARKLVALADLEYVLAWLRQSEAPPNIIGLQERAANLVAGREADD
jgi:hypothetical protein